MTVCYMLEEDLLKHLDSADIAVNLTTLASPWSVGLSEAYAKKFPNIYKEYEQEQEEFKIRLSVPWHREDKDSKKTLYCLPVKTLAKDWGDKDVLKDALVAMGKEISGDVDVIMPITIVGELQESIDFIKSCLPSKDRVHYWVGISEKRAKEKEFKRDKVRVFLTGLKNTPTEHIKEKLEEVLLERKLFLEDIQIVTMEHNKSFWPEIKVGDKTTEPIVYASDKNSINRIIHYSDFGLAFLAKDDTDIKFNGFVQALRTNKLAVDYVRV